MSNGEFYMIWTSRPMDGPHLNIVQACLREFENQDGKFIGVRWRYAFCRPGYLAYADGPFLIDDWRSQKCFGRIVGLY